MPDTNVTPARDIIIIKNMSNITKFIPPFYKGLKTRNVKIFSPKGYPHMHPPLFTEEENYITFNRSNCTFPNAFKELPFP